MRTLGAPSDRVDRLRAEAGKYPKVTSFADLIALGHRHGLVCRGFRLSMRDLAHETRPTILEMDNGHFVTVIGVVDQGLVISDPKALGETDSSVWSTARVESGWTGNALVISTR